MYAQNRGFNLLLHNNQLQILLWETRDLPRFIFTIYSFFFQFIIFSEIYVFTLNLTLRDLMEGVSFLFTGGKTAMLL